jgi:hypothetical protein
MSNHQKKLHLQPVEVSSTISRPTLSLSMPLPLPVGVPAPFHVDANALSRLGADLPTIQALLGTRVNPTGVEGASPAAHQAGVAEPVEQHVADGLLNHSPEWMAAIGRIGGLSRSPAKSRAARLNGAKGGRPRKADPRVTMGADGSHDVVRISSGSSLLPSADATSDAS